MNMGSWLFCIAALAGSVMLAMVAYPLAALTIEKASAADSVVSAEELGFLDLGDFGEIAVTDMLTYYMDNPPEPEVVEAGVREIRFDGC
jgi:hypothetical protein